MVVKALSDPNHDREMEVKIDGSHFVTFSIARVYDPDVSNDLLRWGAEAASITMLYYDDWNEDTHNGEGEKADELEGEVLVIT